MARKPKFDYFQAFIKISDYAVEYADDLINYLLKHYDEETKMGTIDQKDLLKKLTELHDIEEASDDVVHEVVENLASEFVAPIEREDIMALASELDTVVDELDDVLQRMYMYNVTTITSEVIEMALNVQEAARAVQAACTSFEHFKHSTSLKEAIVKIQDCEDAGDKIYIRSVHYTYERGARGKFDTPFIAFGLAGMFAALEKCCDACEEVADIMTTVLLKNS